jgi:hypothetical protein
MRDRTVKSLHWFIGVTVALCALLLAAGITQGEFTRPL